MTRRMNVTIRRTLPSQRQFYRVLHDAEQEFLGVGDHPEGMWAARLQEQAPLAKLEAEQEIWRAGLPEVFPLDPTIRSWFTKDWQLLSYEMNPGMTKEHWRSLYQYNRAFTNGTGFGGGTPHPDYINRLDLTAPEQASFDKGRLSGGAYFAGIEDGDNLIVETMDAEQPAPSVQYVMDRPWLYFVATTVHADGSVGNFPQNDGRPCLIPLFCRSRVTIQREICEKLPPGSPVPNPYQLFYTKPGAVGAVDYSNFPFKNTTAHLWKIDLTKVKPFVTPALGYKLTPAQARMKYSAILALNGDQGPWLMNFLRTVFGGALVSSGRWMSNGGWLNQSIGESSAWFDASGQCKLGYAKPAGIYPWNVISGPKQQIKDGMLVRFFDDDPANRCARQNFGLLGANTAFVLSIVGDEAGNAGATEQENADACLLVGAVDQLMMDSGGSVGTDWSGGVSYTVESRPVLNCLVFVPR